jgi:hypothetical protein
MRSTMRLSMSEHIAGCRARDDDSGADDGVNKAVALGRLLKALDN